MCARALVAAGAVRGDVVHNAYGYGLFTGGLGLHYGAERMGAMVVPASGGNTPRQVLLIADLSARILCCTPSYALHIADTIAEAGIDPREHALAYGLFGAEPWSIAMRDEIERRLGLRALDIYGLSEMIGPGVASECTEQAGAHVCEDHFVVEVVDPGDGRAAAGRRRGRARVHEPDPRGDAAPALPHGRPRLAVARAVRVRADARAHQPHQGPYRRHAGRARRQRLPVRGRVDAALACRASRRTTSCACSGPEPWTS